MGGHRYFLTVGSFVGTQHGYRAEPDSFKNDKAVLGSWIWRMEFAPLRLSETATRRNLT
jgi:hypothetical protein